MTKVYLAGPMSGIKDFNFPAFDKAAQTLTDLGYEVFNPAQNDRDNGFDATGLDGSMASATFKGFNLRHALKQDLTWICENADCLALLPGYARSKGVMAEIALANALGLRAYTVETIVRFHENAGGDV